MNTQLFGNQRQKKGFFLIQSESKRFLSVKSLSFFYLHWKILENGVITSNTDELQWGSCWTAKEGFCLDGWRKKVVWGHSDPLYRRGNAHEKFTSKRRTCAETRYVQILVLHDGTGQKGKSRRLLLRRWRFRRLSSRRRRRRRRRRKTKTNTCDVDKTEKLPGQQGEQIQAVDCEYRRTNDISRQMRNSGNFVS